MQQIYLSLPEYCRVAPRIRFKILPVKPPNPAKTMTGYCGIDNFVSSTMYKIVIK